MSQFFQQRASSNAGANMPTFIGSVPIVPKISLTAFYNSVMPKKRPAALHHIPLLQALGDFRILNLMIISGPGNGKSTCTSIVYPAYLLGHDPTHTILGLSAGENLPQGFVQSVGQIIGHNPAFKRLFPTVQPDKKLGWSTERGLFVTGHDPADPDASYVGMGIASKALTGKHARTIIMDDLHDRENSGTEDACKKIVNTYYDTIMGRGDPQDCRYILSGRRFSTQDIYGHFIESGDWVVMVLPAERPFQTILYWDVFVPKDHVTGQVMKCVFSETLKPEGYQDDSKKYIRYRAPYGIDVAGEGFYWPGNAGKRREYFTTKRNKPVTAESVYQCNPGVREHAIFTDSDFCYTHELTAQQLAGARLNSAVMDFIKRKGGKIVQSWDTGYGKSASSAYSVCITALLEPTKYYWRDEDPLVFGPCEKHNRVWVLDVFRKKLTFDQLNPQVRIQYNKWLPERVLIENRASGISLVQNLKSSHIPVKPIEVREGKVNRAIDAIGGGAASVQGWFRQHRVVWPQMAPYMKDLVAEFLDFSGSRAGYKDQVDAMMHLVAYAIQQGVGEVEMPSDDILSDAQLASGADAADDPRLKALQALANIESQPSFDPFGESCARCGNWDGRPLTEEGLIRNRARPWCLLHNRAVSAIDSCFNFESLSGTTGLVLKN